MKRKTFYQTVVAVTSFFAVACAVLVGSGKMKNLLSKTNAANPTYSVTLNSAVFGASGLTTSYQQNVTQNFGNDKPAVNYQLAKKDSSNNLVLAPAGKLFNYSTSGTYKGRITNIQSVTANYSGGTLYIQEGLAGGAEVYGEKSVLTSGAEKELLQSSNYIMITNASNETTISSITIKYSCSEASFELERLGDKYNGMGSDSNTYELIRNGSSITLGSSYNGTISLNSSGNFTMTLSSGNLVYSGSVSPDYKTLAFTSKSGSSAASAPDFGEMNRIYVLDDFEDYPNRGNGYSADQTSAFTVSNLRAAYYVDSGSGSGATWVSGSTFKIPSTANYLNLSTSGTGPVHSGSKAMLLQGQKAGWVRAWSREVFDQNQHYNFGSGNRLSFWVHSGRNNSDGTGVNSSNVTIRAQAYYQNFTLTDSNRNSTTYGTGTKDFTISTGSGWNECILNLDPTKQVYAINIMINNSGLSTDYVFMPIDDITIYTQPIFEPTKVFNETSTSITKSYNGSVTLAGNTFKIKVGLGANGYAYAYAGKDMEAQSYSISGNQITIVTTGSYSSYNFGTWVGTLSNNNKTITISKNNISGNIKEVISNSTITLNEDTTIANGEESDASLQSLFKKQYNNSSWTDYSSTTSEINQESDHYIQGSHSIKIKKHTDGHIRIFMNPSTASSKTFESVALWYYVPAGVDYTIRIYGFGNSNPVGASNTYGEHQHLASNNEGGWHYFNMGLDKSYRKNFGVFVSKCAADTYLDYITYF